jgi:hypothetical protein
MAEPKDDARQLSSGAGAALAFMAGLLHWTAAVLY